MTLTQPKVKEILVLVRQRYPDWTGFADPDFMKDEVTYKQSTIAKARDLLSEAELEQLIAQGQFDEFIGRLETVGRDTNLLWMRVPMSGDLNVLYQPALDKPTFCEAVLDLLYGPGPSHQRLTRYADYVKVNHLPNKWTFPTYFLFICHPDTEMFIKPRTTRWFIQFVDGPKTFTSVPTPPTYVTVKQIAQELKNELQGYGPRDMVDIQGLIWVCASVSRGSSNRLVSKDKRSEFATLFQEFAGTYPATPEGQFHLNSCEAGRQQGRQSLTAIVAAVERNEDITDQVLLKLLPYADSAANRQKGAWIHIAPSIQGDLRGWFENKGWTKSEDWPRVARAILDFVRRCDDDPEQLIAACQEFSALPYTKGFQTGMLTPILNALRPGDFILINNKSRRVVNYLANTTYSQKLTDYPATNATARELVEELDPEMQHPALSELGTVDRFDMYSHWLVAVKTHDFGSARYWKIAPGERAWNWRACRDGGFMAIGWDALEDISGLSRTEFNARRDELVTRHDDWTKAGTNQVWKFARIKEGDHIVANRGITQVLGIGTVTGPYEFVPGVRHGHRLPVEWDDLTPRQVNQGGWRKTLIELNRAKFEEICNAPPLEVGEDMAEPCSQIFVDREEAEWAFDLLQETFRRLGVADASDERFALTLRDGGRVLRLNFGNWAVLQFYGPGYSQYKVGIALIDQHVALTGEFRKWEPFAQSDPSVSVYNLPVDVANPLEGNLREVYENTFAHIAARFRDWSASNYRKFDQPQIAEAVFDLEKRAKLFAEGLGPEAVELIEPDRVATDGYFTIRTFDLLSKLHENPTKDFYLAHKEEFKTYLEGPFQQLFYDVAAQLPVPILKVMETKKRVFARIIKNDYGQGGAWDFYWGAFYPKGSKRIEDAQLSMWINPDLLEFGFYIGEYGAEQRQRFLRNCRRHYATLVRFLEGSLSDDRLIFTNHDDIVINPDNSVSSKVNLTWREWLKTPDQVNFDVSLVLPRAIALQYPAPELCDLIVQIYQRLFPLVLLTIEDDPIPAIGEYIGLDDGEEVPEINPPYTLIECATKTGFDKALLARWVRAVERKGQAILYGPPGTGKTHIAEHLAKHLVGGGDGWVELVQFHPAYAYEDFVQGIRPKPREDGGLDYPVIPGRFLEFCNQAGKRDGVCVLIIDEINRANLARVFGELMYLLEYRDQAVPLASGGTFSIPKNVRIIGTMNTADRSIALVDHALRRRFAFLALYPNYDILRRYHQETGFNVEPLIGMLKKLNRQIGDRHYEVGIAFFLRDDLVEQIEDIWGMEIEPYLEEYFFDQPDKADTFRWEKIKKDILQ